MNTYLLMVTFRVWLVELPVAALNYFVLMKHIYAPRVGELRAHQLGMSTRIAWIVGLAYLIVRFGHADSTAAYLVAGAFWMLLWLAFEWVGSLATRRPVHEVLHGWHIENGYMWPYVLTAYLVSPLIIGLSR
jgi:hypothetical protein